MASNHIDQTSEEPNENQVQVIKVYDNVMEANLDKTYLESEDIKCVLLDEHTVGLYPLISTALGGIQLCVHESQVEEALDILHKLESAQPKDDEGHNLVCPNCGSSDYMQGYKSYASVRGVLSLVLTVLFVIYPLYFKSINRCNVCQTKFKTEDGVPKKDEELES